MDTIWLDVRYAVRRLLQRPTLTVTAVLTAAVGIGATTAVFSVVDAILLRPLPFRDPARLVQVWGTLPTGSMVPYVTYDTLTTLQAETSLFSGLEAERARSMLLVGGDEPEQVRVDTLGGGLMDMLGIPPLYGRIIGDADAQAGRDRVIVLSHVLWQRRFGGDPRVVGRSITLDATTYQVIGVMPPTFKFPAASTAAWAPLVMTPLTPTGRPATYEALARLAPGVTVDQAQARADVLTSAMPAAARGTGITGVRLRVFHEHRLNPQPRAALLVLFGAVALLLLIACANVANLLLAYGASRDREMAVRASLGASRPRLVRELVIESLLLAGAAGVAGMLFANWGADALVRLAPSELTFLNLNEVGLERRVLAFAVLMTVASGLTFGVLPAFRTVRRDSHEALKAGARQAGSLGHRRLGRAVVVVELALSLVLLSGAGLLSRTFVHLTEIEPGYDTRNMVGIGLQLPSFRYQNQTTIAEFYRELLTRVRGVPGVVAATVASGLPPGAGGISFELQIEAEGTSTVIDDPRFVLPFNDVDAEYFAVTGIPRLAGRAFTDADRAGGPDVVIVNEAMARRLWQGANPVGRRMRLEPDDPWLTVVGVVGNVYQFQHSAAGDLPAIYYPSAQRGHGRQSTLAVRTAGDPMTVIEAIKAQVRSLDRELPIYRIETAEAAYAEFLKEPRFYAQLMGLFAIAGVLLAGIGLYGLMSYTTARRMPELGVRVALGATPRDIARLVLGHGLGLAVAGVSLGLVGSVLSTGALQRLLVGVAPRDPTTLAAAPVLLTLVALVACWLPTRRALRVDPVTSLREE